MGPFKSIIDSILAIWNEATPAARVGILLLSVLCVGAIGGVGYWASIPTYVTLLGNDDKNKMSDVMDELTKKGIAFNLSGGGGNLEVSKSDFPEARMIAREIGVSEDAWSDGGSGGGIFDPPIVQKQKMWKQREMRLEQSIQRLHVVDKVDVILNVPDKGPFERKNSPPSASVILTLGYDAQLTNQQANSIALLVAFAVPDLKPESVKITDVDGKNYSIDGGDAQSFDQQIAYRVESERLSIQKAEAMLTRALGPGNAIVQVSLNYTFPNGVVETTEYDAEGKVAETEDILTESTTDSKPMSSSFATGGVTGVDANLNPRKSKSDVVKKSEQIGNKFLVPMVKEEKRNTTPLKQYMTVSVVVNSEAKNVQQEDGTLLPKFDERVTAIVKNAVGFEEETDRISVEFLPFTEFDFLEGEVAMPFDWTPINEIIRNASLAIAAIVALLIGFLMLRRIKPAPPALESSVRLDSDRTQSINQLGELMKNNPEVFAQIIQSWANAPAKSAVPPNTQSKAAA